MRDKSGLVVFLAVLVSASSAACAVTTPAQSSGRCSVTGADKLPASSGGVSALCDAIERVATRERRGAGYRVEVRVVSRHVFGASLILADGRRLPELNSAISDSDYTPQSFEQFAVDLWAQVPR